MNNVQVSTITHGADDQTAKTLSCCKDTVMLCFSATWWVWLVRLVFGRMQGCARLRLDSGLQRLDAHRFYEANGLKKSCYHFNCQLDV